MGRIEFIVEVEGNPIARLAVAPGQLERCRFAAIETANEASTGKHPAFVFMIEAPWDIGPMVGDRQLVYEAAPKG